MNKQQYIESAIINLILYGNVLPGGRLPSIRQIAVQYHVSVTPVAEAFRKLEDRNIVFSYPNSGYYVSPEVMTLPEFSSSINEKTQLYLEQFALLDNQYSSYASIMLNPKFDIFVSLSNTATSSHFYSEQQLYSCIAKAAKEYQFQSNYQFVPKNDPGFIKEIMSWMVPIRGHIYPEEILLLPSVSNALCVAVAALTKPGGLVAIESPGHIGFYSIPKFLNHPVLSVPSDPVTGLDIDALKQLLIDGIRPDCLLVSSNFSNPTGALMPDENKKALVELCAEYNLPIIEDDILGGIYFGTSRPLPLKSFDHENVIYINGFGKSLSPTMRTAWIAAGKYHSSIAFHQHLVAGYLSPLLQKSWTYYLQSRGASKQIKTLCGKCNETLRLYYDCILKNFPVGTHIDFPAGGTNLWVQLPKGFDAKRLSDCAMNHGITIAPYSLFHAPETMRNCFRINGLSILWSDEVEEALVKLGKIAGNIEYTA